MYSRTRTTLLAGALIVASLRLASAEATLRVGTSGDYPPFSERTSDGYRGFDIALAERFARETGAVVSWVPFRWPELLEAMQAGRFDLAMSGVTVRPERSVAGRFSVPVVETGAVLLVRGEVWRSRGVDPGSALRSFDNPEWAIGVNAGGHLERVTRARFPAARIRAIPDNDAVREALVSGAVDAIVSDTLEAPGWMQGSADVRLVGPFTRDLKAYWLRAEEASLASRLDAWLMEAERDGSLAALRREWFGDAAGLRTASPLEALLASCRERLALMVPVAETKREAGIPVVDLAREERVLAAGWKAVRVAAAGLGASPPPRVDVERFYRAQIDAAVAIQRRVLAALPPEGRVHFDLASQLRPALLRIGERMANLLVHVARAPGPRPADLRERVDAALAGYDLPAERTRAIADSMARLFP